MSSSVSAADHVALVQSIFVLHEFDMEDLLKLSQGKREAFSAKILQLMATTDLAKSKGLTDPVLLKKALEPTKRDKDVKAAQGMLCSMIQCKEPPAMLGVFWCM